MVDYTFFTANNRIIFNSQFGFRKNHPTTMAITEIVDSIRDELDNEDCVTGVYLHLSKSFYMVNHKILLEI